MLIWLESICRPPNLPSSYCCVTCDPSSCSGVNCREFLCVCRECAGGSGAQGEADPEAESPAGGQRWQGGKQSAGKWQLFSAFYCNHVYSQLLLNFCFCALFGIRNVICDGWEAGSVTALNPGKHSKLSVCVWACCWSGKVMKQEVQADGLSSHAAVCMSVGIHLLLISMLTQYLFE